MEYIREAGQPQPEIMGNFPYSPENPPSLADLESRVYAIHITPILPENGTMIAGAINVRPGADWRDEPPSFRPTIHFALGEIVPEHELNPESGNRYAVVASLGALEDQLVNVLPHDTFILGNLKLTPDMTVVAPAGTDLSDMIAEPATYQPGERLRDAVDRIVAEKGGWPIRMQPQDVEIDAPATVEGVDINDPRFFGALLDAKSGVSFGTHTSSEIGGADSFGIIEQASHYLFNNYNDYPPATTAAELQLYKSIITENLGQLDRDVANQNFSPETIAVYADKREKLMNWLNIVDCDLRLQQEDGKTLARAPHGVREQAKALRADPKALLAWCKEQLPDLPDASKYEPRPNVRLIAALVANMNPSEMKQLVDKNLETFGHIDMAPFAAKYAAARWMYVRSTQAKAEGLDTMLADELAASESGDQYDFFEELEPRLAARSNRLGTALDILRQPAVQQYLTEKRGFIFNPDEELTLQGVLRAHPYTRILFEPLEDMQLTPDQTEAGHLLEQLDVASKPTSVDAETLDNFNQARDIALHRTYNTQRYKHESFNTTQPMSTARDWKDMRVGDSMTVYEQLQRFDPDGMETWRKLGLEKQYVQRFKTPEEFWQSNDSLLDIYRQLSADRDAANN
ncbi:MAG TPA: hypothetical protein VHT70_02440 [Candidatus Saccharimonadales bacterium]|nr:hypothetical protein [Candidatus Saccharimonadales bacterium]